MAKVRTVPREANPKNDYGIKADHVEIDEERQEIRLCLNSTIKSPTLEDVLKICIKILENMEIFVQDPLGEGLKEYKPWHWVTWHYNKG